MTDEIIMFRERRSPAQGHINGKSHSQALSPGILRPNTMFFLLHNWTQCLYLQALELATFASRVYQYKFPSNKLGFCWSESRALRWHPTVNAILLSHWPHRNRWGENAECSSSCSCCPDPHELWCSKGKMKR